MTLQSSPLGGLHLPQHQGPTLQLLHEQFECLLVELKLPI